jgi:hypothetical protein
MGPPFPRTRLIVAVVSFRRFNEILMARRRDHPYCQWSTAISYANCCCRLSTGCYMNGSCVVPSLHSCNGSEGTYYGEKYSVFSLSIFWSFFGSLALLQIGVLAIGNKPMCSLLVTCYFTCKMTSSTHSGLLPPAATTTCH